MFIIYGDSFEYLDAYFDRIKRESGEFNAPKIKIGGRDIISVTSTIRDIVSYSGLGLLWYLFWFGLSNEKVVLQIGNIQPSRRIGRFDIDRANANFKRIGRLGEELVNSYLESKARRNEILHFNWYNANKESGLPYDFTVENHSGNIINLDVKSTKFDFLQKLVFSTQEIK